MICRLILFVCFISGATTFSLNVFDFTQSITFLTYGSAASSSQSAGKSNGMQNKCLCLPGEKFAVIVHGWHESCQQEWVGHLMSNLTKYRGGCIICMDYAILSHRPYHRLVRNFASIVEVLTIKLQELQFKGFRPQDGYIFGFSFGARVALQAAINAYGTQQLAEIDACEPAGPGFDGTFRGIQNASLAAKNVQCIHTSNKYGSSSRTCHQNWNMGHCGDFQVGAGPSPKGNHGLCPYF